MWVAGFFDGEGCIYIGRRIRKYTPQYNLQIDISQKDRRPLDSIVQEYGGSVWGIKNPSGCYRWRITGKAATRFLERILPYSLVKRNSIEIGLAFQNTIGMAGRPLSVETRKERKRLRRQLCGSTFPA